MKDTQDKSLKTLVLNMTLTTQSKTRIPIYLDLRWQFETKCHLKVRQEDFFYLLFIAVLSRLKDKVLIRLRRELSSQLSPIWNLFHCLDIRCLFWTVILNRDESVSSSPVHSSADLNHRFKSSINKSCTNKNSEPFFHKLCPHYRLNISRI